MHRIYFDTNDLAPNGGYCLGVGGSLRDGLHVIIYMTGELEMEAVLEFDARWKRWTAHPIEGTTKIYPEAYLGGVSA